MWPLCLLKLLRDLLAAFVLVTRLRVVLVASASTTLFRAVLVAFLCACYTVEGGTCGLCLLKLLRDLLAASVLVKTVERLACSLCACYS